jgi:GDPmannose 4,6-dehydratase
LVKALITGITGMDGSHLTELLLSKGYSVHGLVRRNSAYEVNNIEHLKDKVIIHYGDLLAEHDLALLIHDLQPDEIYNLAAQSDVQLSFECPEYTNLVNYHAVLRMLQAIRNFAPFTTKFYQASTSEMFGNSIPPQNEDSNMFPASPYGASKLGAFYECNIYRKSYGMFICNGILFNHESERRGLNFVTRKVTKAAARIKLGLQDSLELGNLDAKRDWGYAPDYVYAMWLMLQQDKPDDYAIGTGESRSIRELLEEAFGYVNLDWQQYVSVNDNYKRPNDVNYLQADSSKARKVLGWKPTVTFSEMIRRMVENDLVKERELVSVK